MCFNAYSERKWGRKGTTVTYGGYKGCEALGRHPTVRSFYKCSAANAKAITKAEARKCAANLCSTLAATY